MTMRKVWHLNLKLIIMFAYVLLSYECKVYANGSCVSLIQNTSTKASNASKPAFIKNDPKYNPSDISTWAPLVPPLNMDGKGRGFVSSFPKHIEKNILEAEKRGLFWWGQKIVLVKDLSEAVQYMQMRLLSDPLMYPLFLITGKTQNELKSYIIESNPPSELIKNPKALTRSKLYKRKKQKEIWQLIAKDARDGETNLFYRTDQGWSNISSTDAERFLFSEAKFTSIELGGKEEVLFYQNGWVLPPLRGVVNMHGFFANTSRWRKFLSFGRKLQKEGIISHITFNKDPEGVIRLAGVQNRLGQKRGGHSRFNQETIDVQKKLIEAGLAYSVEVWDKQGNLIGGGFGNISDGKFNGESVAYPVLLKENGTRYGIEIARLFKVALFDVLYKAGFKFQDSGMVTPFTEGIGGAYIPVHEYLNLLQQSIQNPLNAKDVEWPEKWTIPEIEKNK